MKKLTWLADSRANVKSFPAGVQDDIGYALYAARLGEISAKAKPLHGLGSGVMEIAANDESEPTALSIRSPSGTRSMSSKPFRRSPKPGSRHRSPRWNWFGSGSNSYAVR
jgi:hypothetical protein